MAVIFQLIVAFPLSAQTEIVEAEKLAENASLNLAGAPMQVTTTVGNVSRWRTPPTFIELSAHPFGMTDSAPLMAKATPEHLRNVGDQLYELLGQMRGYLAGYVGWDSEWLVDIEDLETSWVPDGSIYDLSGLVVAASLAEKWSLDDRFRDFAPGFRWLPYIGTPRF